MSAPAIKAVSPMTSGDEHVLSSNSSLNVGNNNNTMYHTTSYTIAPEVLEENERLRKENMQLNQELSQLSSLCNNILTLMTNYGSGFSCWQLGSSVSDVRTMLVPEGKTLKLLPVKHVSSTYDIVHVDGVASCHVRQWMRWR